MALRSPEEEARVIFDVTRASIAYIRAIRDGNEEDEYLIFQGIPLANRLLEFPIRLAQIAVASGEMTDEYLDELLAGANEAEATGRLARHISSVEE